MIFTVRQTIVNILDALLYTQICTYFNLLWDFLPSTSDELKEDGKSILA